METILKTTKGEVILRSAGVSDAPAFRDLRLEALQRHPEAFSSDFATSYAFPTTFWEQRLIDIGICSALYFAVHEGSLVGMVGIRRESSPKLQHTATIWGVYVREEWRGLQITEHLIELCVDWARQNGVKIIKLAVVNTNTRAIKTYTRCGFTVYGLEPMAICLEGVMYDEMLMALIIGEKTQT